MPDWPHAPMHRLEDTGAYMVTAGTYLKQKFFSSQERLRLLQDTLLRLAQEFSWELQAWCVFANHYHFVAISPSDPSVLRRMIAKLHTLTAKEINRMDNAPGRRIWYQYWDSHITFQRSYLARLKYVHYNAVHHGIAKTASEYPWCSACWFETEATPAFQKVIAGFKTDRLSVIDDF